MSWEADIVANRLGVRFKGVSSSAICSIGYLSRHGLLFIEFNRGALWAYEQVPPAIYDQLVRASSIGRFFQQQIKNVFAGFEIDADNASIDQLVAQYGRQAELLEFKEIKMSLLKDDADTGAWF